MGRGYSILAVVILLVAVVVVGAGVMVAVQSRSAAAEQAANVPTQVVIPTITPLPSVTPTRTPLPTLPPTFTPTPTVTLTPTVTSTPTFTPSSTPTITDTPTLTFTPVSSATSTPTNTPTVTNTSSVPTATRTATNSPFPFQLRGGEVIFTSNTFNEQACAYQGIGGQVLDQQNVGINDIVKVVVVDDNGRSFASAGGDNSRYGPRGGYEIGVDTQPNRRTYFAEVRSTDDTVLSPSIEVTFPSDCDRNVALLYFEQTRPF